MDRDGGGRAWGMGEGEGEGTKAKRAQRDGLAFYDSTTAHGSMGACNAGNAGAREGGARVVFP